MRRIYQMEVNSCFRAYSLFTEAEELVASEDRGVSFGLQYLVARFYIIYQKVH